MNWLYLDLTTNKTMESPYKLEKCIDSNFCYIFFTNYDLVPFFTDLPHGNYIGYCDKNFAYVLTYSEKPISFISFKYPYILTSDKLINLKTKKTYYLAENYKNMYIWSNYVTLIGNNKVSLLNTLNNKMVVLDNCSFKDYSKNYLLLKCQNQNIIYDVELNSAYLVNNFSKILFTNNSVCGLHNSSWYCLPVKYLEFYKYKNKFVITSIKYDFPLYKSYLIYESGCFSK